MSTCFENNLNTLVTDTPHRPFFSAEEYRCRLERVQEQMGAAQLDALIVHQPENIAWLSGVWHDGFFAYHSLVVPQTGQPQLIMRAMEDPVAQELSYVAQRHLYLDGEDPLQKLRAAVLETVGPSACLGIEYDSNFLSPGRYASIQEILPAASFASSQRIVEQLRQIKSTQEMEYLRVAGRIVSAAMEAGMAAVGEGVSELEIAAQIASAQARAGHDGLLGGLGGSITSGWRTNQFHAQQSDRILAMGDRVRLELAGIHKQYWAKQMRSAVVGPVPDSILNATEIVRQAQDAGIGLMGPGVSTAVIADACRRPILAAGLTDNYDNRVAYGLGLQFHPTSGDFALDIDSRSDYTLRPGMVFHVLLFAAGASLSETVAITENGHEILTSTPREIYSR